MNLWSFTDLKLVRVISQLTGILLENAMNILKLLAQHFLCGVLNSFGKKHIIYLFLSSKAYIYNIHGAKI